MGRKPFPSTDLRAAEPVAVTGPAISWNYELGGTYDVAHGAGLAALWGSWARYVYDANPERFAQFATNVFEIPCSLDFNKTALAGIEAMEDFFRSIKMPTSLHDLGLDLTEKEIHDLAFKCSYEDTRTIGILQAVKYERYGENLSGCQITDLPFPDQIDIGNLQGSSLIQLTIADAF